MWKGDLQRRLRRHELVRRRCHGLGIEQHDYLCGHGLLRRPGELPRKQLRHRVRWTVDLRFRCQQHGGEQPHLLPRRRCLRRRRSLQRQRLHDRLFRLFRLRERLLLQRRRLRNDPDEPADLPLNQLLAGAEKSMQAPPGRQTLGLQK